MKLSALLLILISFQMKATIHVVKVWDGYFQFLSANITIQIGDTVQWLPLDQPTILHTITSTSIPFGAASFNVDWKAPADTFFQYIPQIIGTYNYECTPHATSYNMIGSITVEDTPNSILENRREYQVFPNPVLDRVNLSGVSLPISYMIFDNIGTLVLSGTVMKSIEVTSLSKGIYYLELNGDRIKILKIIKL